MEIQFILKSSARSRYVRIAVHPDGKVIVTKPNRTPVAIAEEFVRRKSDWIEEKLEKYKTRKFIALPKSSIDKREVLQFVKSRIDFYNQHYKFNIAKISIKNHKSLWGSCSARKNLNFNIRILHLPIHQADYIIVHELCHLQEFNHSKNFWKRVAETIPNYKSIKQELRSYTFY